MSSESVHPEAWYHHCTDLVKLFFATTCCAILLFEQTKENTNAEIDGSCTSSNRKKRDINPEM